MFSSKEVYYNELRRCVENAFADAKIIDDDIAKEHDPKMIALEKCLRDYVFITYPLSYANIVLLIENLPRIDQRECEQNRVNDDTTPVVSTFRLRRSEIYDSLSLFRPELRESLIRCVSAPARIQDDLLDALDEENKEAFISILKSPECDYSYLASELYDMGFIIKTLSFLDSLRSYFYDDEADEENLFTSSEGILANPKQVNFTFNLRDFGNRSIEEFIDFMNRSLSFTSAVYKCYTLFPKEASILKPILESDEYLTFCENHKDEIDNIYKLLESDKTGEEISKFFTAPLVDEQDGMVSTTETPLLQESSQLDGGVKKKEVGTPDASVSAEEAEKPRNKGGRKRAIWYKGDYSEEEVKSKLEAVWKGIELYMDELVYYHHSGGNLNEVKQGPAREQAKKALGAALILSATNEAGLAKESNSTCTESIGRWFRFLAGRNSIQPYFEVVNSILVKAVGLRKQSIDTNFIEKRSTDCKNATPLHKLVLLNNYLNLYILYNNSVCLICEQFKLKTSRKFIDWPEPEDKVLSRSKEYKEGYGVDSSDSSDD